MSCISHSVALRVVYLVVSTSDVCTDGTHERSNVVHKAIRETLAPRNIQFRGQE